MAYGENLMIVDLQRLEQMGESVERKGKELVAKILAAPHILKVTHDTDKTSLSILQRALVPNRDINVDNFQNALSISPLLDLAVVAAFVKQMSSRAPAVTKLLALITDYLRVEMCMGEALSNFERRPLRQSQMHYALTLAWCPLMILRVWTTYGIVEREQLLNMTFQLGCIDAPPDWDEKVRQVDLCSPQLAASPEARVALDTQVQLPAPSGDNPSGAKYVYGDNPWKVPEWVAGIPRPDQNFNLCSAFPQTLILPEQLRQQASDAINTLHDGTMDDLDELYETYQTWCQKNKMS
jgi:hypothetical protein